MIKKIAYLVVFIIFGVIAFMYILIERQDSFSEVPADEFDAVRPDYSDTRIETIFKEEMGNKNND
jgi:hypothetical protein